MNKQKKIAIRIVYLMYFLFFSVFLAYSSLSLAYGPIQDNLRAGSLGPEFSNATIISDGYNGVYWNNGGSGYPSITVDDQGGVHAVWRDRTNGTWGVDSEIMYSGYTKTTGWSYPLVISDGFEGRYWNDGGSYEPSITADSQGNLHVVWHDDTNGTWGIEYEIMYVKYKPGIGWSNITIISDGYEGIYWNDGFSSNPSIDIDNQGGIHVAWHDSKDGVWGEDFEIMYVKFTPGIGWSNATVISDGFEGSYWNDGYSLDPSIAVDGQGGVHVAWEDATEGPWGNDNEVMYVKFTPGSGWSNATIISGGVAFNSNSISDNPSLTADDKGYVYLTWVDRPGTPFGSDNEILFSKFTPGRGWSNASVVSDGFGGNYWNDGQSSRPSIDIDYQGNIYIVWDDGTEGPWRAYGGDYEIMYSVYTERTGWTYPLVISDGFSGSYWNHDNSWLPSIAADNQDRVHIVWWDYTEGPWKTDTADQEIMYVSVEKASQLPGPFTLSSNADNPDVDGSFALNWTESANAEEYSVYLKINGTNEEFATGIIDTSYTVNDLSNGTYTFVVEASNEYGTILSNEIDVIVERTAPSIPFGNYFLGFLVISALGMVVIVYYKLKYK